MYEKNIVLLIYPSPFPRARNLVPLNLLAIARMLDPEVYKVIIVNSTEDSDYNYFEKYLRSSTDRAVCVGITAMTGYQIKDAIKIAKWIKKAHPNLPIVWGGYHPTILPLETVQDPNVDIVVIGQGEVTFKEVVERLSKGLPLKDVRGIVFKDNDRKIVQNLDRPLEDLNNFPPLSTTFNLIDRNILEQENMGRTMTYFTSQGCPYNCKFCAENIFSKRRWVPLDAQRVVDEIEEIITYFNVDNIRIVDNNFFANKKRVRDISEGIIKKGLKINLIKLNGRVDNLLTYEDDLWKLMYRAGIREILIGAESGDQEFLDLINKKIRVEDTVRLVEKASLNGMKVWVSLMTGIPSINQKKEFKNTINLVDKLVSLDSDISVCQIFNYTPYPGSELFETSKQQGFNPPKSLEEWAKIDLHNFQAPWISKKYSRYANNLALYMFPRLFSPIKPKNSIVILIYGILDKIIQLRWRYKFFDFFFEKYIFDSIDYLRRLKTGLFKV